MIQVLLLILKIIGITILAVLGLILLVLALVLFVPIFYRVRVIHNPNQTKVSARISFLFPLLLVSIQYLKKLSYNVRVFGLGVLDSEKPKKEKKPKKKKEKQKTGRKTGKKKNSPAAVEESTEEIWVPLEQKKPTLQEKAEETEEGPVSPETEVKENKPGLFEKIRCKLRKIRETISNIVNKIKKLLRQKDEVQRILAKPETKQALSFAWDKLKRLLKHVLPRKIKGYLVYGADNPATTGQVLGILSIVYARTGQLLEIRPDFVEKQLECDVIIKGRIQMFTLLVIAIKVVLNQELRQLISEFKGLKEIE